MSDFDPKNHEQLESEIRRAAGLAESYRHAIDEFAIVSIADTRGSITYVNDLFCQISRYSRAELLGQNHRMLKSGFHPPEFFSEMWRAISAGETWRGELRNRAKDGNSYWVDSIIVPFLNEAGRPYQYFSIRKEITDRKNLEAELIRAREEALAATQAKSKFLANMSHEIRTPMNAIIGMADLLLETQINEEQERYLRTLANAGDNLLGLINDILDLSRVEAGQLEFDSEKFDLLKQVESVVELFALRVRQKGIDLGVQMAPGIQPSRMGDANRVRQVLVNLLGNALKFTTQGKVELVVQPDLSSGSPDGLHFSVHDTGIGMSDADVANLFKPFTQADSSIARTYGGTGLGLSICKELVERMGGRIWAESQAGEGSRFHFTVNLPIAASVPENAPEPPRPVTADRQSLRILLVDDSEDNRTLVLAYLKDTSWQVRIANDGEAAVALVQAETFDVVLMDLQMPVMDGYAATRAIRSWEAENLRGRTRIVALSVYALVEERAKSLAAGCDAHLTKPIRKAVLLETIGALGNSVVEIHVDPMLADLVPGYLEGRRRDLDTVEASLKAGDLGAIMVIGHRMRGVGASYGFCRLSELGAALEDAAKAKDAKSLISLSKELRAYLDSVRLPSD